MELCTNLETVFFWFFSFLKCVLLSLANRTNALDIWSVLRSFDHIAWVYGNLKPFEWIRITLVAVAIDRNSIHFFAIMSVCVCLNRL